MIGSSSNWQVSQVSIPSGFSEERYLQASDGIRLHYYQTAVAKPRFQILAVHGLGEHAGRYGWLAQQMADRGASFSCLNLRGHGLSEGQRGHSPKYQQLLQDFTDFVATARIDNETPAFLFGHSLGGGLVLNYCLNPEFYSQNADCLGVIASAPLLRLSFSPPAWKLYLARKLLNILPNFSLDRAIDPTALSRVPEIQEAYRNDSLKHRWVSAAMTVGFLSAGELALSKANLLKLPALIMHGEADRVTSIDASIEFTKAAGKVATFKSFPLSNHELINEPERDHVIEVMGNWMEKIFLQSN